MSKFEIFAGGRHLGRKYVAKLLEQWYAQGQADEREACAKIAESMTDGVHIVYCGNIAEAIRARGKK